MAYLTRALKGEGELVVIALGDSCRNLYGYSGYTGVGVGLPAAIAPSSVGFLQPAKTREAIRAEAKRVRARALEWIMKN
jgi:hypothetical protein